MSDLKGCPFCGCKAYLYPHQPLPGLPNISIEADHSSECPLVSAMAFVPMHDTEAEAAAAWNTRSQADAAGKLVEQEREACAMVALSERCERGTAWDLACTTIAAAIRNRQALRSQHSVEARGGGEGYIAVVPDHCDTIAWRGAYHTLPPRQDKSEPSEAVGELAWLVERNRLMGERSAAAPDGDGLLLAIADEDSMSEVQVSARLTAQTRIWHAMKDLGYTPTPEGVKAIRAAAFGGLRDAHLSAQGKG